MALVNQSVVFFFFFFFFSSSTSVSRDSSSGPASTYVYEVLTYLPNLPRYPWPSRHFSTTGSPPIASSHLDLETI
ncbi:hypothetical protein F4780DRAFT_751658 [Xylariomycetidae sp. FL0641]|nr:hypothetical protein F4780DRAFT_751658 [Xylariomycetidae sp. FL0641]